MNSVNRALAESNNSYERCCMKAAASPERLFASGPAGISATHSSLSNAQEQYQHNRGWVYAAVSAISKRLAGQRICVGKPKRSPRKAKSYYENLEPLESHPILDMLADPNPLSTGWSLIYSLASSLLLTGRGHCWIDAKNLWYLPSHWCDPADMMRGQWIVRPKGMIATEEINVPGDDLMYVFLPTAEDPFGVQSPLQAAAHGVAIDENIQSAQFRAFKNGIFPGLMVKVGSLDPGFGATQSGEVPVLDEVQRRDLVSALKRLYGGTLNYGEPLIVDGLITGVEKLSLTPQEMDFTTSADHVKARILQAFGVNPLILGQIEGANRAQAVVAEQSFCSNVINPLAMLISSAMTEWLGKRHGVTVWLEPAVADDDELKLKAWQYAANLEFVTPNEFRRNVLNLEDIPGGDERLSTPEVVDANSVTASEGKSFSYVPAKEPLGYEGILSDAD